MGTTKEKIVNPRKAERKKKILLFYTENVIVYIENPKEYTKQLLELNKFMKVMGHKTNSQNPTALLYINSNSKQLKNTGF